MVYLIVAALILAAAIYTQANLLFWSFGLMVGGLVASLIVPWLMLGHVQVQRLMPSHGVVGEMTPLRYQLHNGRSWLPIFNLMIRETWGPGTRGWKKDGPIAESPRRLRGRPHAWVLHLGPSQTAQAEAPCHPLRRGILLFDRVVLSTSFPFGILRREVEVALPGTMTVYPRLYRVNRRLMHRLTAPQAMGRKQLQRGGGREEFFGLREYHAGDSLGMVDWKGTARSGELVSRELTHPSPPRMMVLLDFTSLDTLRAALPQTTDSDNGEAISPDEHVERAISLAASIVCDAHLRGHLIGLAMLGVPMQVFPMHHSLPHRTKLLDALATVDVADRTEQVPGMLTEPTVIIVPGPAGSRRGGRAAILATDRMDEVVGEARRGSHSLLDRRSAMPGRRAQLQEGAEAWN